MYRDLVKNGKKRLSNFDNSKGQAMKYLEICNQILKHE